MEKLLEQAKKEIDENPNGFLGKCSDLGPEDFAFIGEYICQYNKTVYQIRKIIGKFIEIEDRKNKSAALKVNDSQAFQRIDEILEKNDLTFFPDKKNLAEAIRFFRNDYARIRHVLCHFHILKSPYENTYIVFSHNSSDNKDKVKHIEVGDELFGLVSKTGIENILANASLHYIIMDETICFLYKEDKEGNFINLEHLKYIKKLPQHTINT